MKTSILSRTHPVTLIGGGQVLPDDIAEARALAPTCVAADGGADRALAAGITPEAVIGDMDSLSAETRAVLPEGALHHIAEQDSTDFDKALRSIDAPAILAVGFAGRRVDHTLAAFHTLVMRPETACVMLCERDVVFLCPPRLSLAMAPGTRVSLFPMAAVTGRSRGLEWPIDGLAFAPDGTSGTSNRATGDLYLEMDAPGMLCILPRRFLPAVTVQLAGMAPTAGQRTSEVASLSSREPSAPLRWPARAAPRRDRPPS